MDCNAKLEIESMLSPHHPDYDSFWKYLCSNCYHVCEKNADKIKKEFDNWKEGTRRNSIKGFRIVKNLGRIEVHDDKCKNPEEVKDQLKIYSIQKGGNGFINFWWDRQLYQGSEDYLAGYSDNGNPYYKTRYYRKQWYTGYAYAVYVEPFEKRCKNTFVSRKNHRKNFSSPPKLLPLDTSLIIDGLNVCRWYRSKNNKPNLLVLMTLLVELAKKDYDFFCFFDANTPHELNGNHSDVNYSIYKKLIGNYQKKFGEAPGRIRADDFILKEAGTKKASIVSNDQFRDYLGLHPWIRHDNRLIKGMVVNEKLLIPPLDLALPLRKDLKKSLHTFQKYLNV